ncbi:MAG: dTDP-4-dehydrorhamnose 3,5-epimerase [Gemmatimonadales bacterium]
MKITPTAKIPEVLVIEPTVHSDERGFFLESWHEERLAAKGLTARFVQDNHSRSVRGTLRGLHYQTESPQGKLVRVVYGAVYDVAVDLRRSSPTFGQWVHEGLTADNHKQLWIPPGFAHGFYVVSEQADLLYKCTTYYAPGQDRALRWDDPDLAIDWPLVKGCPPILSAKDASAPLLRDAPTYP